MFLIIDDFNLFILGCTKARLKPLRQIFKIICHFESFWSRLLYRTKPHSMWKLKSSSFWKIVSSKLSYLHSEMVKVVFECKNISINRITLITFNFDHNGNAYYNMIYYNAGCFFYCRTTSTCSPTFIFQSTLLIEENWVKN